MALDLPEAADSPPIDEDVHFVLLGVVVELGTVEFDGHNGTSNVFGVGLFLPILVL